MTKFLGDSNNAKNVIILTDNSLIKNGVGSLFIKDLVEMTPNINYLVKENQPFFMGTSSFFSFLYKIKNSLLVKFSFFQFIRLLIYKFFFLKSVVDKIKLDYNSTSASFFWITLSTPELIMIADKLVDEKYDVRVTVWDDPEYLMSNLNLPHTHKLSLLKNFSNVLSNCKKGMVISYAMYEKYKVKYGLESCVVRHGIKKSLVRNKKETIKDKVRIVFAGSLYAKEEWNNFVSALDFIEWNLSGKCIDLYYIGDFPLTGANKPDQLKFLGRKSFEGTMEILYDMHIGYLPYWFSDKYELVARTSFPGKLSAYTSAGLAIFHHGPNYTEVTSFLNKYSFGVSCDSYSRNSIIKKLDNIISKINSDEYFYNRELALNNDLSICANFDKFNSFIN